MVKPSRVMVLGAAAGPLPRVEDEADAPPRGGGGGAHRELVVRDWAGVGRELPRRQGWPESILSERRARR